MRDVVTLASRFVLEAADPSARPTNVIGIGPASWGVETEFHAYPESLLLLQVRGELTCEGADALWIVPPQSALWVPGGMTHRVRGRAPLEGYRLFIEPWAHESLRHECCVLSVSTLFREVMVRLASRPARDDADGRGARLARVLIDELAAAEVEDHRLPMPAEPRLRHLAEAAVARPADASSADIWAKRMGMGRRTINRLMVKETGLSFDQWRRRLHLMVAIQRLARGASVQQVAIELGYGSPSSFVMAFRKAFGTSPGRYMAHRLEGYKPTCTTL